MTALALAQSLAQVASERPDQTAVADRHTALTWAEFDDLSDRLAIRLAELGVNAERPAVLSASNRAEHLGVTFACWKLGSTCIPLNPRLAGSERIGILSLIQPAVIIDESHDVEADNTVVLDLDGLLNAAHRTPRVDLPTPAASAPWRAIPSGGSTGTPKLIIDQGPSPTAAGSALLGMRPAGRSLLSCPLYHNAGFAFAVFQLVTGGTVVVQERFDPAEYLHLLAHEQINHSVLVPTMMFRVARLPEESLTALALPHLEVVLHTAAMCPNWLKRRFIELIGPDRLWELYGSTETGATMITGQEWLERPGSVGRPFTGFELRILTPEGQPVPAGSEGEVWIKPPSGVTAAYQGASLRLHDGAISVGDQGYLDDAGYLYLLDRRSDLIIRGGANVYPAEVEGALSEHPDVADVAVIGIRDDEWGQRIHAIVQPSGSTADAEVLLAFARQRLGPAKTPGTIEFVADLLRDPSGKIRRQALRSERDPEQTGVGHV